MTNCHYKRLESLSFKELQLFGCSHLFPHAPYPQRNSERNWALSEEQRREEQLPPPLPNPTPSVSSLPTSSSPKTPVPNSLQSIVKTQPPSLSVARALKTACFA